MELKDLLQEFTGTPLVHQSKMNYINIKCNNKHIFSASIRKTTKKSKYTTRTIRY